MTKEKILSIIEKYQARLYPLAGPIRQVDGGSREQHVMWMCKQIQAMVEAGQLEKANRWLGFVQGALWYNGLYTIDEMREHNRDKI